LADEASNDNTNRPAATHCVNIGNMRFAKLIAGLKITRHLEMYAKITGKRDPHKTFTSAASNPNNAIKCRNERNQAKNIN
jgi:hypothetical protein